RAHPLVVLHQVSLGERNIVGLKRLSEILQHVVVNFEVFRDLMVRYVMLGEVEKRVMLQQGILEAVALLGVKLHIRRDAAATVNRAAAVGELHFFIGVVVDVLAIEIIVIQRDVAVVALNQASAGR